MAEADGVLVFDPSGVVKQGKGSVGVARQWCGRVGKIDNCQVGIYMGYVTRKEHALVDVRLYMPKEWMKTDRLDADRSSTGRERAVGGGGREGPRADETRASQWSRRDAGGFSRAARPQNGQT